MRLFAHHEYVCRRHGYWLGPPDVGQDHNLRHLADLPEILTAQRKHQRLVRAYGPIPIFDAIIHAFKICAVLWKNGPEETYGDSRTPPAPSTRALCKHHQAARYFAKKRYAANTLIYHHHTNAPVIETYYPQPGPYARQRARLAAQG